MLRPIVTAFLFAALAAFAVPSAEAAMVFPTGLRVGLEAPPGLVVSHRFPGFEDPAHRVLVAIFQLPAQAYDKIMQADLDKSTHGLTDVSKADFAVAGGTGYLVSGEAKVNDHGARRWLLLAKSKGGDKGSALATLIRVDVPDAARTVYSDAVVRKMLASVDFRAIPTKELLSLLPFKLEDLAGFRIAHVVPGGAILTDGPSDEFAKAKQPYLIVSVGRGGPSNPALRGTFARDMLRNVPLNDLRVTSADTIRIGRVPAFELRAKGQDATGQVVTVVQWLRFGAGGYMRIVGVAPKDDWDKVFNRFRAVRDGIASR